VWSLELLIQRFSKPNKISRLPFVIVVLFTLIYNHFGAELPLEDNRETSRIEELKQDSRDKTTGKGQPRQVSQDMIAGQLGLNNRGKIIVVGQLGQERGGTGQAGNDS
jgi:hypothetical protein